VGGGGGGGGGRRRRRRRRRSRHGTKAFLFLFQNGDHIERKNFFFTILSFVLLFLLPLVFFIQLILFGNSFGVSLNEYVSLFWF
jgi:hypothetical protein